MRRIGGGLCRNDAAFHNGINKFDSIFINLKETQVGYDCQPPCCRLRISFPALFNHQFGNEHFKIIAPRFPPLAGQLLFADENQVV